MKYSLTGGAMKEFVCEFCGIYSAEKPKCNKCESREIENRGCPRRRKIDKGLDEAYGDLRSTQTLINQVRSIERMVDEL